MSDETTPTNVYRIVLLVVDHDRCGVDGVKDALENARFPNRCISPAVMSIEERTVDWSDEHPLNHYDTEKAEFERLFNDSP